MKKYDAQLLKQTIANDGDAIKSIWLGMKEDFAPTADEVFRNGKTLVSLDKKTLTVAGIEGSIWATPVMRIEYYDGRTETAPCYFDDGETAADEEKAAARKFAQDTNPVFGLL